MHSSVTFNKLSEKILRQVLNYVPEFDQKFQDYTFPLLYFTNEDIKWGYSSEAEDLLSIGKDLELISLPHKVNIDEDFRATKKVK